MSGTRSANPPTSPPDPARKPQHVQHPLVSVAMPVYNAQQFLATAVTSILAQTVSDFEVIAVDDGSTDASLSTLEELARTDPRLRIVSRPNTGIVGALNDAVSLARGAFLARMDADDIALPHRFERQLEFLRSHPDCVAVGSAVVQVDPDGDPICVQHWAEAHEEIEAQLLLGGGGLAHPTAMIRASALRAVGGYRAEYQWIEDKDLWLRLAEVGRLANLPEPLLEYRLHERSVCWRRAREQRQLWEQLLVETYRRRGLPGPSPYIPPPAREGTGPGRARAKWIRAATRSGNYRTAAKHARHLCGTRPLEAASWLALLQGILALLLPTLRQR